MCSNCIYILYLFIVIKYCNCGNCSTLRTKLEVLSQYNRSATTCMYVSSLLTLFRQDAILNTTSPRAAIESNKSLLPCSHFSKTKYFLSCYINFLARQNNIVAWYHVLYGTLYNKELTKQRKIIFARKSPLTNKILFI